MKPIEYFSLFEDAKKAFTAAKKLNSFPQQIKAAEQLMKFGHVIIENNYHTQLRNLFTERQMKESHPDMKGMFEVWGELFESQTRGFELANLYYGGFYTSFVSAGDVLEDFSHRKDEDIEISTSINQLKNDIEQQFAKLVDGIGCIVKAMTTPLSHVIDIVHTFCPDSILMKDEKIAVSLN